MLTLGSASLACGEARLVSQQRSSPPSAQTPQASSLESLILFFLLLLACCCCLSCRSEIHASCMRRRRECPETSRSLSHEAAAAAAEAEAAAAAWAAKTGSVTRASQQLQWTPVLVTAPETTWLWAPAGTT
nr:unnamed protein product [Digitaria exilis]